MKLLGMENGTTLPDTLIDNDQYLPNRGRSPYDWDPYFGRVLYTYGLTLDQPLLVTRYNYVDLGLPRSTSTNKMTIAAATLEPSWDFKGRTTEVTCATGTHRCAGTRTSGAADSRIVIVPGNYFAYERDRATIRTSWHGSLLEDKEGAARTLYRRNRVYDPAAGRFTQEDPIGLAGGLNLYGFAGGDPVNFSDPFGLCPDGTRLCEFINGVGGRLAPIQGPLEVASIIATLPVAGGMGMMEVGLGGCRCDGNCSISCAWCCRRSCFWIGKEHTTYCVSHRHSCVSGS